MKSNTSEPKKSIEVENIQKTLDIVTFLYFEYKYKGEHKEKLLEFFMKNNPGNSKKDIFEKILEFEKNYDDIILVNLK